MLEYIAQFDQQLFLTLNNGLRSPVADIFLGWTTWLGEGFIMLPLVLILCYIFDRPHFRRNAVLFIAALVLAGLIGGILKEYFERPRPLLEFGGWKGEGFWNPGPYEKYHVMFTPYMYKSFPSGHAATVFTAATLFSLLYRRLSTIFFILASIVMISRVYVGAHFPLDTVAGAFLGMSVSYMVWRASRFIPNPFGGDAGVVKRTRL